MLGLLEQRFQLAFEGGVFGGVGVGVEVGVGVFFAVEEVEEGGADLVAFGFDGREQPVGVFEVLGFFDELGFHC